MESMFLAVANYYLRSLSSRLTFCALHFHYLPSHHCISRQSLQQQTPTTIKQPSPSHCIQIRADVGINPHLHSHRLTLSPSSVSSHDLNIRFVHLPIDLPSITSDIKMSTYSPRRHTHDSASRPKPHYNDYEPTPMRYEITTSPPSTSTYMDMNERNPMDRIAPGSGVNGHGHHHPRTSSGGSSSSHATGHRPPPRLVKKTSFSSSTYPSSSRPHRKQSIDLEDDLASQDDHTPHRSGSLLSEKSGPQVHHVHHKSGHHASHHRHHSGHRHENGGGYGQRRPPSPDVLDEEIIEDIDEPPTRAHVDVYNADQFWAGKFHFELGPHERTQE